MENRSSKPLPSILWLGLAVFGVLALCSGAWTTLVRPPAEDAVILHQYSRNLAETGIISYIPGGAPAEGATDFLWMLYIALGLKLKVAPVVSTALANVVAALVFSAILLRFANKRFRWVPALAIVGTLALMPQALASVAGFSVLVFGLLIASTVWFSEVQDDPKTALAALLLCLLRPDGIVFAIPIIARRMWMSTSKAKSSTAYGMLFVLPGLLYFLWRWHYFGYFFPLPFLVKSSTQRVWGIFGPNANGMVRYLVFAAIAILGSIGGQVRRARELSLLVAIIVIPAFFYSTMRLDQNVFDRFYYFIPLAVAIVIAQHWDMPAWGQRTLVASLVVAFLLCILRPDVYALREYADTTIFWRRNENIAKHLSRLRGVFLTSEAGEFAYFSRWKVYDSWGLNTPEYAVHLIQPKDVVKLSPDLVGMHTGICKAVVSPAQTYRNWDNMFSNVRSGVALHGHYDSWTLPLQRPVADDNPHNLCFYVKQSYPERVQVEGILASYGATLDDESSPSVRALGN